MWTNMWCVLLITPKKKEVKANLISFFPLLRAFNADAWSKSQTRVWEAISYSQAMWEKSDDHLSEASPSPSWYEKEICLQFTEMGFHSMFLWHRFHSLLFNTQVGNGKGTEEHIGSVSCTLHGMRTSPSPISRWSGIRSSQ